jgi:3-hydroxyacyl-[acyl-carrier-protein] dehydratase
MRFLLIDRITVWQPGIRAVATKNVALSEDFFEDHFPDSPVMPGTLILEGMAQLGGLLLQDAIRRETGASVKAVLSLVERAKFRAPVFPGDQLEYTVELRSVNELAGRVEAVATCGEALRAECALVFAFHEFESERLQRKQSEIVSLWMRGLPAESEA